MDNTKKNKDDKNRIREGSADNVINKKDMVQPAAATPKNKDRQYKEQDEFATKPESKDLKEED